jgi:uncharacterized protein (TIGR02147 family)
MKVLHFSDVLKIELEKRKSRNRKYSIRAFARDLGMSASGISLLIRGKTGLSNTKALQIAERLKLNKEETAFFADLVLSECGRLARTRREAKLRLKQYDTRFNAMKINEFHAISEWHNVPILEIIRIHGVKATPAFIAEKLAISESSARRTILRLRKLGMLKGSKTVSDFMILPDGAPDHQVRKFHQEIIDKARLSIVQQRNDERNISCALIPMRKEDFLWASEEIRKFRRNLAARLEDGSRHDSIYAVSMQLFRLDRD